MSTESGFRTSLVAPVGFALLGVCALALAQTVSSPDYRSFVDLTVLEIRVEDGEGGFVGGLGSEDFAVAVDGRAVPLSLFYEVDGTLESAPQVKGVAAFPGGAVPKDQRRFLFFLDFLSPTRSSVRHSFTGVLHFLENLVRPGDLVGLAVYGERGFAFPVPFTDRHERVRAAVRSMSPGQFRELDAFARTELDDLQAFDEAVSGGRLSRDAPEGLLDDLTESAEQDRGVGELVAYLDRLAELADTVRVLPGTTQLVLMSRGFVHRALENRAISDAFESAAASLERSGVIVHAFDPGAMQGITVHDPAFMGSRVNDRELSAAFETAFQRRGPLHELADRTGGTTTWFAHNLEEGLDRLDLVSSQYYVLGFRVRDRTSTEVTVDVSVRMENTGAIGYPRRIAVRPQYDDWTVDQRRLALSEAISGGHEYRGLELDAGLTVTAAPAGSHGIEDGQLPWATAAVYMTMPSRRPSAARDYELLVLGTDAAGRVTDFIQDRVTEESWAKPLRYTADLAVSREGGRVVAVVRDAATGALASRSFALPQTSSGAPWLAPPMLLAPSREGLGIRGRLSYRRGESVGRPAWPITVGQAALAHSPNGGLLSRGSVGLFVALYDVPADTRVQYQISLERPGETVNLYTLEEVGRQPVPGGFRAVVGFAIPAEQEPGIYQAHVVARWESGSAESPGFEVRVATE